MPQVQRQRNIPTFCHCLRSRSKTVQSLGAALRAGRRRLDLLLSRFSLRVEPIQISGEHGCFVVPITDLLVPMFAQLNEDIRTAVQLTQLPAPFDSFDGN